MGTPERSGAHAPAARLKHRIPVRVRHYWKLLATCAVTGAALVVLAGNVQIRPIVTSGSDGASDEVVHNVTGTVDLFDATVAHSVTLSYDEADYQRMMDTYMATGDKEYVRADITIDGTRIEDVGIRLKGNSTLSGLNHKGKTRSLFGDDAAGGRGGFPEMPEGVMPSGFPAMPGGAMPTAAPGGGQNPGGFRMPGGGGMSAITLDSAKPEELPWLISFDEFADGRRYQGHRQIAVRISGMGGVSTVLNEALSLEVIGAAGQPTQQYAYAGLRVNDRPVKARLLVESPDANFADGLGDGVLYKSLSTGRFTYQGEDATEYADDYKQINNKGSHDLQPVIDLVKWVEQSSDADFAAHLGDHVDVESFARYVATQNLLLNFDDMAGPGRNFYLWYDLKSQRFTVIGWDYNLTFTGSATQGPHDTISMAGMMGGMNLPDGLQLPEGFAPPQAGGGDPGGGLGGLMMGNKLKERFLASDAFTRVYEDAYRQLYQKIYANAAASKALDAIAATLSTVDGYDATATASDTAKLRTTIEQRTAALAKNEVIAG